MINHNAILYTTHKNFINLWGIDLECGIIEFYKRNPFDNQEEMPLIIIEKGIATFLYNSRRPKVKSYRLIMLEDAIREDGLTPYTKGKLFTKFKTRRETNAIQVNAAGR